MKNKKNYGPDSRKEMESNETSEKIETGLPGSRMSETVQVETFPKTVTPASTVVGSGDKKDIVSKQLKEIKSRVRVRPNSDTELLDQSQVGGVPIGSGQAVVRSAAGVSKTPTTVEDSSRIPYTDGGYRPDSRSGKKTSDNDFIINNSISEQLAPQFEGSKDLRKNPDGLQGYNGQKQFTTARGKKNAGTVPQSILYDRSVDFYKIDSTVHTTGQVLDNIEPEADYPTITGLDNSNLDEAKGYTKITNPMHKSNYILKSLNVTIKGGKITGFSFNEDQVPAHAEEGITYQTNLNWQVDRNNVTKTMIKLQKELGRETTEKWSPLGYVLRQPYQYNMLAHDMEAMTGAMMLGAYRAINTSLAFQSNNKLAKDGAKPQTPVIEMFLDGIGQTAKSITQNDIELAGNFTNAVFGSATLRKGSAAAIIKMFDSISKYTTKANFFNLPKSLKYFSQTMDNHINPLHCKKEFLMALDTAHVFSTIDGNYNPMLPIYATDKISIVNPMSLNYFVQGWDRSNITSENPSGTVSKYTYKYGDLRNVYTWQLKHPVVEGLLSWIMKHESAFVKAYVDDSDIGDTTANSATVTIPCFFSMLAPSMFQMLLAAASQEILWARSIYFRDFLFAGDQMEYIWPDLDSLEHLNPKFSSNLTITDYKTPLKVGKMKPASFIHILWGDQYSVFGAEDPAAGTKQMVISQPWYYNEVAFTNSYSESFGFYNEDHKQYVMSYPEERLGVNHDYLDMIFSMDERDVRLALDRAISIPLYKQPSVIEGNGDNVVYKKPSYQNVTDVNTQVKVRACRYDLNSDGRVLVNYDNEATNRYLPNKASVMCLPRELGYLYPHFRVQPIILSVSAATNGKGLDFVNHGTYKLSDSLDGSIGHSIVSYQAEGSGINSNTISRSAALQQSYVTLFADRSDDVVPKNEEYVSKVGIIPAISGLVNVDTLANEVTFNNRVIQSPFYNVNSSTKATDLKNTSSLISLSQHYWTVLNRLFCPINPFENCLIPAGSKDDFASAGALFDPFEDSFMFGLAGFLASDFEQDVLDRAERYDQLNIDYTEDAFIKDSLVFRAD